MKGGYSTGLEGVDGVNGVAVVVVPALTAAGVQSDFVKDLVHLRLRREGIRVSPQDPESDQPTLDVTVGGMQMVNSLGVPFDGVCSESVGKTAIVRGEEIWQRPRSRLGTDAQ